MITEARDHSFVCIDRNDTILRWAAALNEKQLCIRKHTIADRTEVETREPRCTFMFILLY